MYSSREIRLIFFMSSLSICSTKVVTFIEYKSYILGKVFKLQFASHGFCYFLLAGLVFFIRYKYMLLFLLLEYSACIKV